MKTYRPSRGVRLAAAAALLWACACGAVGQDPAPEAVEASVQPEEYNEYEAIPPPQLDLRSGVASETPGETVPEPPGAEPAEPAAETPAGESDPLMDQVNRELAARRGATPSSEDTPPNLPASDARPHSLLQAFAWLLVVIALILLVYYGLQRRTRGGQLRTGTQLAAVLGRIYLSPRMCLHFVRTGGKVLVVGQTQNALSLIASFDEAEFAVSAEPAAQDVADGPAARPEADFFSQLRSNLSRMHRKDVETDSVREPLESIDEDDIAALRGDIHRLQEYLRDSTREPEP